ncbi:hypothetical protein E3N88_42390 [Mikania micrantha]|uniref:Transposase-associated domain-containing protein n=1 Tax=Mikania micrantha TaxID=192012 RepID=A0A5N6LHW0_9ASTR|nr:hypothetical protein E3N88_42390 [Mikania micrantha]
MGCDDFVGEDSSGLRAGLEDAIGHPLFNIGNASDLIGNQKATENTRYEKLHEALNNPLYEGCNNSSILEFVVKLMNLKVMNKWTDNSFELLLNLLHEVLPDDAITCSVCQSSRYVRNKIAYKKLRYFPIAPRLKRLYASRHTAKDMRWHKEVRKDEDGALRHPADGKAWKHFDDLPIVDELKVVWHDGVEAYDVYSKSHFTLYAAVLWTISDFPTCAYLSGWSTMGRLACPICLEDTRSNRIREHESNDLPPFQPDEELPDTSLIVRNDVEPESLSYEAVLAIRNANASGHDLIDTDDEHDDLGRIFLNNESILDSDTDHDSTDPDHNSDDDDSFA